MDAFIYTKYPEDGTRLMSEFNFTQDLCYGLSVMWGCRISHVDSAMSAAKVRLHGAYLV